MKVKPNTEKSLSQLLLDGEIDCALTALPPKPFRDGDKRIKKLVRNARKVEEDYYKETGIFPIMHLITIRKEVAEKYPWVAVNMMEAFEEAKNNGLRRALHASHSHNPIPWGQDGAAHARDLFGDDFWPYGLEPNRPTIEAFLKFGYEQGVCHRKVKPEELFLPQSLNPATT